MDTVPRALHQSMPVIAREESGASILTLRVLFFDDLAVGLTESFSKTVSSSDVVGFAEVTGDRNPIHLSEHFAAQTAFGTRIAHGLYTASLISALLGTRLPGPGAIYLSQTLNFRAPVRIGDTVLVSVTVAELLPEKSRARLTCTCRVDDDIVLDGEAVVKVPLRAKMRRPKMEARAHPAASMTATSSSILKETLHG
jgi:3-hydroxybutyryl-CoA dehydratase